MAKLGVSEGEVEKANLSMKSYGRSAVLKIQDYWLIKI